MVAAARATPSASGSALTWGGMGGLAPLPRRGNAGVGAGPINRTEGADDGTGRLGGARLVSAVCRRSPPGAGSSAGSCDRHQVLELLEAALADTGDLE